MTVPFVARPKPFLVNVKAGQTCFWCSCGRSANQPFCDGSHKGTAFSPRKFTAGPQDQEVLFCGCKNTRTPPFCDGAHTNLPGGSPLDDPDSPSNSRVPVVSNQNGPRALLNGGCYVFSSAGAAMSTHGSLRYCYMVTQEWGSLYQTQLLLEVAGSSSPVLTLGPRDVILFVSQGNGTVNISGRDFRIKATDGVYIRPAEAMQLTADAGETLRVFVLASPQGELEFPERLPENFDSQFPQRVVKVDPAERTAMGTRYFQILVDQRIGSKLITQFIGHIPRSKAVPHRHLYEEAIIILTGEGFMWTEECKARVRAGDVVFLPRKQFHSLEATSVDGIDVVGVICPGDNPSINYYD